MKRGKYVMYMKSFATAMITTLGFVLTASAANAWGVIGPPPFNCTTTISDGSTINTNLIVPPGATCTLTNATVKGNVDVEAGATFITNPGANQKVTIGGNVAADNCNFVRLLPPSGPNTIRLSIGNNVSITDCTGAILIDGGGNRTISIGNNVVCSGNSSCEIRYSLIGGNLTVDNNSSATQSNQIGFSSVSGNVDFRDNTAAPNANAMFDVIIGGNLKCVNNTPAVLVEAPNEVSGNTTGCPNPT
jgi:hypothetical protein